MFSLNCRTLPEGMVFYPEKGVVAFPRFDKDGNGHYVFLAIPKSLPELMGNILFHGIKGEFWRLLFSAKAITAEA